MNFRISFVFLFVYVVGFSFALDIVKYIEDSLKEKSYVVIPEGIYYVNRPIVIKKSDVTIRGNGRVTIVSEIQGSNKAVFKISGRRGKFLGYISKAQAGQRIIEGSFNTSIKSVRYIWVYTENTPDFVFEKLKSKKWFKEKPYLRQGIYKVRSISSEKIILEDTLDISYPAGAKVYAVKPIVNITLENLTIIQGTQEGFNYDTIKHTYENLFPDYRVDAIHVKWGANILLKNITVKFAGRHALNLEYCYGVKIKNLKVFGSLNKGKGGNGYVRFSKTHKSVLEHCYIEGIRHLTFQWASSRNVVRNCTLKVDVNFHGGFERFNKVISSEIIIPKEHPWSPVEKTPLDAHWAPPSGPGNEVKKTLIKIE